MTEKERMDRLCAFTASLPTPKTSPLVLPDGLGVAINDIFHHFDPRLLPEIADVLEHLMEYHPKVLAAVGEVDRTLIWDAMERTPIANLAGVEVMAAGEGAVRSALKEAASREPA